LVYGGVQQSGQFDQHVPQNSLDSIVPDLALSWAWSEDAKELTFKLRQGVKWHDEKPFTAADIRCTWDLIAGKSAEKLRVNPRKSWYRNLDEVTVNGDFEVTFHLKRQQPSFLALLASGWSPSIPATCAKDVRLAGRHRPFKFVEFKPNETIKIADPDYWKPGRPISTASNIRWSVMHRPV
jgi:peptide/nickel transport system substrate-binding protein